MPKKKNEEVEETTAAEPTDVEESTAKPKRASGKKAKETAVAGSEELSIVDEVIETVSSAVETVAEAVAGGASALVDAVTGSSTDKGAKKKGKRAEKIGVVASDKMTKTVVVRVDRLVKHPIYRKYVKKRKKFMAHDETGAKIGDKVRIVETRPLSARKRWRVVEIIQKAEL